MHIKRKCIFSFTLNFIYKFSRNSECNDRTSTQETIRSPELYRMLSAFISSLTLHWTCHLGSCLFTHMPSIKEIWCSADIFWNTVLLYCEVCAFRIPTIRQLYVNIKCEFQPLDVWERAGGHLVPYFRDFNFIYYVKMGMGPWAPTILFNLLPIQQVIWFFEFNWNCSCFKF